MRPINKKLYDYLIERGFSRYLLMMTIYTESTFKDLLIDILDKVGTSRIGSQNTYQTSVISHNLHVRNDSFAGLAEILGVSYATISELYNRQEVIPLGKGIAFASDTTYKIYTTTYRELFLKLLNEEAHKIPVEFKQTAISNLSIALGVSKQTIEELWNRPCKPSADAEAQSQSHA